MMGVDLIGRQGLLCLRFSAWDDMLDAATKFGWKQKGTVAPEGFNGQWDGRYYSNDWQQVTDEDALALGEALSLAARQRAPSLAAPGECSDPLSAEYYLKIPPEDPFVDVRRTDEERKRELFATVVEYALKGGFAID